MAGGGFLPLLDDVFLLTKKAAAKTGGVIGDDLALNASMLQGAADPARELPVVYKVAKGSLKNKAILIPAALGISTLAPALIPPMLMMGGAYLCYEGVEKIMHGLKKGHGHGEEETPEEPLSEQEKIDGAVRTDFVLSAEIITLALGTVAAAPLLTQLGVLSGIGALMTAGVYGAVAGIVKIDDAGLHLVDKKGDGLWARTQRALGLGILKAAPGIMKTLSVAGTAAMFTVGGGIIMHGIPGLGPWVHHGVEHLASLVPYAAGAVETVAGLTAGAAAGVVAGFAAQPLAKPVNWLFERAGTLVQKVRGLFPGKTGEQPDTRPDVPEPLPVPEPLQAMKAEPEIKRARDKSPDSAQGAFAVSSMGQISKFVPVDANNPSAGFKRAPLMP